MIIDFWIQYDIHILCEGQENQANLEMWSKNPLAELSQLLLLLLINHSSSSSQPEAPEAPEDHCYRMALYHCYSHKGNEN